MEGRRRRIGIMGGTFDPIHMGHLILGERSYEQLSLEKVWFMPSGNPPHKQNRAGRASDEQRVEMVRLAIQDNPHFALSLAEMHEEGYTYTYRTLEYLRAEHPDTDYFFIIGADSLYSFHTWKEPQRICDACTLVVATRNHTPVDELDREIESVRERFGADVIRLDTMNIDVSSQMMREYVMAGKSLRYYLPDPVIRLIHEQNIYKCIPGEEHADE